ncbi:12408_t:CDS:2 [Ambispora gerdemannii]|uniref:12408_t:CDS:1 n=1 Tax=Ambispora gerdemannii TaxID=144530 RepID=A0A9N8WGZ2_9GLOM|nr:12408_t:CDS:2 [Ambispora gerdemannii]
MSEQKKALARPPTDKELFNFKFIRVLNEDPRAKTINVLGSLQVNINEITLSDDESTNYAILLLEKTHFHNEEVANLSRERVEKWLFHESNDIYHQYFGTTKTQVNLPDFKVTIIWPATETPFFHHKEDLLRPFSLLNQKHIQKYSLQSRHLINETPAIYHQVVKPFIESIPPNRITWVYNILSKEKESEKILLEEKNDEKGFILLPDMQEMGWRDIGELKSKILEFVPIRFPGVGADELRLFVHYQPSYYHFHLHVTHICQDSIPGGIVVGKAHLLDTIIDNIANIANDYYQKATLTYVIGENEALFEPLTKIDTYC